MKEQADIVRVVGEYVQLRRSGAQNYQGLCPFHHEKTPSFSVHATRQFFHCFGCGFSGDVFTFIQKIENVTFPEAVRAVAQKLGIEPPKMQFSTEQEAREARMRGTLLDLHEAACAFFEEQLRRPEGAAAREYLKDRGLNEEAVRRFRIGYAPESGFMLRDRLKGAANDEALRASGLFSWKDKAKDDAGESSAAAIYSKFRNRITFPICNESGKVIAFTGRTLATDEKSGPKYLNSPETAIYSKSRVLFNLHLAKEHIRALKYAILVEGQMDCISLFNAGYHNAIASSGTAFTEPQARLLGRYARQIVVNFDPDAAGAAATERSLALLVSEDFEIKVLTLEHGYDPDLFIRKKGKDAYNALLLRAPRYFDYLIERARAQFPVRTPDGKVKAVNFLLPHVQRVPSRIVRDELAADIAQKLQIDSAVLRQELKQAATSRGTQKVTAAAQSAASQSERVLIRALAGGEMMTGLDEESREVRYSAAEQAHYSLATEQLHLGLPTEPLLTLLLKAVEERRDPMTLEMSEEERALLHSVLLADHEPLTADLLHSAVESLRIPRWEARQQEIRREMDEATTRNDRQRLQELWEEKKQLDAHLRAVRGAI